ncbi:MAG TPA: hypothetical protein VN943_00720 [Candidatus Acidoferrum sp.]|nr:hypothetical protein [Candidatus Acidoferrum sp.]
MALPETIPLEIVIRGTEGKDLRVEDFANFLRDLVFLHDRLWMMGSEEYSESVLAKSFFFTRHGRPIPKEQQLKLVSLRKESPFELVVLIGSAIVGAPAAWIYFRILRGALLLPGEVEKQDVEIEKGKSETQKLRLESIKLSREIAETETPQVNEGLAIEDFRERRRRLQSQGSRLAPDLASDLRDLPQSHAESFEERVRLVERDVKRISDHEIVITEITVRRYTKVKQDAR